MRKADLLEGSTPLLVGNNFKKQPTRGRDVASSRKTAKTLISELNFSFAKDCGKLIQAI